MIAGSRVRITYVTSSHYKRQENTILTESATLHDGSLVAERFLFDIRSVPIKESLEVNLEAMVRAEVRDAYSQIHVPCIVEHAGLVFSEYASRSYPGGLTKPMWDTLGKDFLEETHSAGRRATARAVVGYCDGLKIVTFTGETHGALSTTPRGRREFYWDTVFIPDSDDGAVQGLTYAEVVERIGLEYKVLNLSQSTKAMLQFLEHLVANGPSELWSPSA